MNVSIICLKTAILPTDVFPRAMASSSKKNRASKICQTFGCSNYINTITDTDSIAPELWKGTESIAPGYKERYGTDKLEKIES